MQWYSEPVYTVSPKTSLNFTVIFTAGLVRQISSTASFDDIAIDIYSDNLFNEGREVAVLEFTTSENRPHFLFGTYRITQVIIIDRSEWIDLLFVSSDSVLRSNWFDLSSHFLL